MPISRHYGGYSSYSSIYSNPYTHYRGTTPAPNEDSARRDSGHYSSNFSLMAAPATYKYLSRSEYYSSVPNTYTSKLKTINTQDIDVEQGKQVERDHAIPGEIKRDTNANIARGKQVVRMVTSKQKSNPYSLRNSRDETELTLGQRLALKHLFVDPKDKPQNYSPPTVRKSSLITPIKNFHKKLILEEDSAEDSSDWTWETCSSSEEGPDVKYFPADSPKKQSSPEADQVPDRAKEKSDLSINKMPNNVSRQSVERWARVMLTKSKRDSITPSRSVTPQSSCLSKNRQEESSSKYNHVDTKTQNEESIVMKPVKVLTPKSIETLPSQTLSPIDASRMQIPVKSSQSSEVSSESPLFCRKYSCPGYSAFSSDDEEEASSSLMLNRGWRKGQPPRSDVVVKVVPKPREVSSRKSSAPVISFQHSKVIPKIFSSSLDLDPETSPSEKPCSAESTSTKESLVRRLNVSKEEIQSVNSNGNTVIEGKMLIEVKDLGKEEEMYATKIPAKLTAQIPTDESILTVAEAIDEVLSKVVATEKMQLENKEEEAPQGTPDAKSELLQQLNLSEIQTKEEVMICELGPAHPLDYDNTVGNDLESCKVVSKTVIICQEKKVKTETQGVIVETLTKTGQQTEQSSEEDRAKEDISVSKVMVTLHKQQQNEEKHSTTISKDLKKKAKRLKEKESKDNNKVPKDENEKKNKKKIDDKKKKVKKAKIIANVDHLMSGSQNDEGPLPASQLERLPSPMRKFFEMKSKLAAGEEYVPEVPKDKPKYWDNTPKVCPPEQNPAHLMAQMKQEAKRHQKQVEAEQSALLNNTNLDPEDPWYNDETEEFQQQLKTYEHRPSDHHKENSDKRSPEENMAVIKLYGGIQFPGGDLQVTPKGLLKRTVVASKAQEKENASEVRNSGSSDSNEGGGNVASGGSISESESEDEAGTVKPAKPVRDLNDGRPKFRKYGVDDFSFLKVLGKGSFGKVILAELRGSKSYYAVKCLKKDVVLEDDDIECTMIERKVLALGCKHPFLCHLFCTFQTHSHLFFVMEYLNGGDLMFHIQQTGRFDLERAKFYSAEILLALKFLHRKGIVYRDLKLDNLLLDYEGHIRIADFGMCKLQIYLDKTADTFCGTPDYMAPEIIKGLKYTYCVDWWSFGVLLYEMLIGQSPFNGCDEDELFWSICNEQPYFPRFLSREAKHILQLLLEKDPSKRLGVSACVAGDVCDQPFFKCIDFARLEKKELTPPYRPKLRHALDVSYFDEAFTKENAKLTPVNENFLESVNQMQFKGFSYTNPNYTLK